MVIVKILLIDSQKINKIKNFMKNKVIHLHENDNIVVASKDLKKDETINIILNKKKITFNSNGDICLGHKIAIVDIEKNDKVFKYGYCIGHAIKKINLGEHVHFHNLEGWKRVD